MVQANLFRLCHTRTFDYGLAANLVYVLLFLVGVLLAEHYQPGSVWPFIKRTWRLCLIPFPLCWIVPALLLILRYALENWQRGYPPPFAAVNPNEAGMAGPIWGMVKSLTSMRRAIREDRPERRADRSAREMLLALDAFLEKLEETE